MQTTEEWVAAISDPAFWIEISPQLSIDGPPAEALFEPDLEAVQQMGEWLRTEGYFQVAPCIPEARIKPMAQCLFNLSEAGLPPVFAFVYDEFWQLGAWFRPLLRAALGDGFRQLPDFWAWYVDPQQGDHGWGPHRDKGFDCLSADGSPRSLTVWMPLTHATTLNGCMYVLPAGRDDNYLRRIKGTEIPRVQDVRALPAAAGSFLCWNQALLHWGGSSSPRTFLPRISIAIEYQRGDIAPFNRPLLEPGRAPLLAQRLSLIGKQIRQYRHMHGLPPAAAALGELLHACFPLDAARLP